MPLPIADLLRQALAKHNSGRLAEAEALYNQILEREPLNAEALHLLGLVDYARGAFDAAIGRINSAIALNPESAVFFSNLGQCYLSRHERPAAELCFRKALELDPDNVSGANNLAWLLIERRQYDGAIQLLKHVLNGAPRYELALANLGRLHTECREFSEALECFEKILDSSPSSGMALLGKLNCLFELHRTEEALALTDEIPKRAPSHAAEAFGKKGELLMNLGRLDEAREAFDAGLLVDPANTELLFARSQAVKALPNDSHLAALPQTARKVAAVDGRKRAQLCYALGKTYADLDDMESAARYYAIGAEAMSRLTVLDEAKAEQFCTVVKMGCDRPYLDALRQMGNPSDRPIFVLGMMRSGTTLTEQFLASHPAVFAAGELSFMSEALANLPLPGGIVGYDPSNQVVTEHTSLAERAGLYLERASELPGIDGNARFTDKMPNNYLFLGLIWAMFPNAKIIHCRRSPIDTCISNYVTLFSSDLPWSYDFGRIGRHYRRYHGLMQHWRQALPGQFLELAYEQTIAEPEATARRLLDWCGLDWDDRVLEFHKAERIVRTASVGQVRQPIYHSSRGRWKKWAPYIGRLLDEIEDLEKQYQQELTG